MNGIAHPITANFLIGSPAPIFIATRAGETPFYINTIRRHGPYTGLPRHKLWGKNDFSLNQTETRFLINCSRSYYI